MATGALMATVLGLTSSGQAQPSTEDRKRATALQVEGVNLFERGEHKAALATFEEAYRVVPSPKILFNIGRAHLELGDEVHALRALDQFLDESVALSTHSRAEAATLARRLAARLGYLEIISPLPDAVVTVDGESIGRTPLPRPVAVAPGTRMLQLTLPGYLPFETRPAPLAGQKLRVTAMLTPQQPLAIAETAPGRPEPLTAGEPLAASERLAATTPLADAKTLEAPVLRTEDPKPVVGPRRSATIAWIAAGSSAALIGAGVTAQLMASAKYGAFNDLEERGDLPCGRQETQAGGESCSTLLKEGDQRMTFAIIGYVAGGAAAVLAATLFVASRPSPSTPRALACSPQAGSWGLACRLSF